MAGALIVLGLIIFGRGIVEVLPWTFSLMGALMAALGLYRLVHLGVLRRGRRS
jgi:hypothetical protein